MSALRDTLAKYVAIRRALGSQLGEPAVTLGHFVEFLEREGAQFITMELALRWAQEPEGVQRATWARRLSMVRGFAAWLSALDPRTEVPPRRILEARRQRNKPHIFTDYEIGRLMAEAARLSSPTGLRALTHVTLIGLLAATGLRPGEALALDTADVDLQSAVLTIRQSRVERWRGACKEQARFHLPLIELDVRICRIQLSDWIHLRRSDAWLRGACPDIQACTYCTVCRRGTVVFLAPPLGILGLEVQLSLKASNRCRSF